MWKLSLYIYGLLLPCYPCLWILSPYMNGLLLPSCMNMDTQPVVGQHAPTLLCRFSACTWTACCYPATFVCGYSACTYMACCYPAILVCGFSAHICMACCYPCLWILSPYMGGLLLPCYPCLWILSPYHIWLVATLLRLFVDSQPIPYMACCYPATLVCGFSAHTWTACCYPGMWILSQRVCGSFLPNLQSRCGILISA